MANFWQGNFPALNIEEDGILLTAPVGSYPPNDYGLCDMACNGVLIIIRRIAMFTIKV